MGGTAIHPKFVNALTLIDSGDVSGLRALLAAVPALVHARAGSEKPHYDGYFANATLLHHVAGNPTRDRELPGNIVDVARVLLDAGAEVDALCGGGPSQPTSVDWTPLGLVASGYQTVALGVVDAMMDLLVERGADVNHKDGMNLWAALFHVVEYQRQSEAAAALRRLGAEVDLAMAAALGDLDTVRGFLGPDGSLTDGAYRCWRPPDNRLTDPEPQVVLDEALAWAALGGRNEAVGFLLDQGAAPGAFVRIVGETATAMHFATWAAWPDTVRFLVERGASPSIRDRVHHSTPIGWAVFLNRGKVLEYLVADPERIDMRDAAEVNHLERLRELLGDGDPDQACCDGEPGVLLRAAAAMGNFECAEFLLERGADPTIKNSTGQTPADYAKLFQQDKMLELLAKYPRS